MLNEIQAKKENKEASILKSEERQVLGEWEEAMEGGQADISIAAGDLPLSSVHSGLGVNVSGPQIQLAGKHCEGRCAVIPVGGAVHFPK